jgi:monoamine oxidase
MVRIRDLAEQVCQSIDLHDPVSSAGNLDTMTFEEWVRSMGLSKTALASATIWTRAMLGLDPPQISALYFLDYLKSGGGLLRMRSDQKHGGQYLRLVDGMFTDMICC